MQRQIISIAATAIALGTFAVAPRTAGATPPAASTPVTVTAVVTDTFAITTVSNASTTTWNGAALEFDPFVVAVTTNDPNGYTFTFTGTNGTTGSTFEAIGTTSPSNTIAYTVIGGDGPDAGDLYNNGTQGTFDYPNATPGTPIDSSFEVVLPITPNVQPDTYTDTITAGVSPGVE